VEHGSSSLVRKLKRSPAQATADAVNSEIMIFLLLIYSGFLA
jgi:hypothetical protein